MLSQWDGTETSPAPWNHGLERVTSLWYTYTPGWLAVTTQPALNNGQLIGRYRRIGDDEWEYRIDLQFGSTTSAGSGDWFFLLPPGHVIDTAKYTGSAQTYLGMGAAYNPLTTKMDMLTIYSSSTASIQAQDVGQNVMGSSQPFSPSTGAKYMLEFRARIVG
jgi:hypothetical protein